MTWLDPSEHPLSNSDHYEEILFIAKPDITDERIGIYIWTESGGYILLKRTDIDLKDIRYYILIPKEPK